jgi:hypothetical protein
VVATSAAIQSSTTQGQPRQRVMPVAAGSPLGKGSWVEVNIEHLTRR